MHCVAPGRQPRAGALCACRVCRQAGQLGRAATQTGLQAHGPVAPNNHPGRGRAVQAAKVFLNESVLVAARLKGVL